MGIELGKKSVPPQLIILVIIAKHNGVTLRQLFESIKQQQHHGYVLNYLSVDELSKDLNVLHLLGLIQEIDGKYVVTDRGKIIVEKILRSNKNASIESKTLG
jgi:c-di-GMP-related signal transduction protein